MTTTCIGLPLSQRIGTACASYGFDEAGYNSTVQALFCKKGIQYLDCGSLAGRRTWHVSINSGFEKLISTLDFELGRELRWKAGLVNLVLYNYRESLQGRAIVPCLFCIDADTLPAPFSIHVARKTPTAVEIRRAYKLCHDSQLPKVIHEIALKTFVFVKVHKKRIEGGELDLDQCFTILSAPWDKDPSPVYWCPRDKTPKSPFLKGIWRTAVQEFVRNPFGWTGLLTHTIEMHEKIYIKERHKEGLDPLSIVDTRAGKSSVHLHLVSGYLKSNDRDKAVEEMKKIPLFDGQREAIEKIVEYDLKQPSPDFEAAIQLATGPYAGRSAGWLGAPLTEREIVRELLKVNQVERAYEVATGMLIGGVCVGSCCSCSRCLAIQSISHQKHNRR
jgi:hypothetical protein